MDADLLRDAKTLTGLDRVRILGRLADGRADPGALAEALGLARRTVVRELGLLAVAGLVEPVSSADPSGRWVLRPHGLMDLGRRLDELDASTVPSGEPDVGAGAAPEAARVMRAFVDRGRLVSIPAQEKKREVILDWLLDRCFADDRAYPEREVNALIAEVHPDTASLRRYLVDSGRMTRAGGVYRRARPDSADPRETSQPG
jgi:DNA-binding transcriptional ArsR family regulator